MSDDVFYCETGSRPGERDCPLFGVPQKVEPTDVKNCRLCGQELVTVPPMRSGADD